MLVHRKELLVLGADAGMPSVQSRIFFFWINGMLSTAVMYTISYHCFAS